ncbi:MAG: tape measure protein [Atopobiaceae bacterium]|nr:tape measure protein [Atopobiaceae bacterium]
MSTNLGTAYVSVMPSMQGFGAAVESGMSGIDTSKAGASMGSKAAAGFAGGMAKNGAIIGTASALATKAFDAVVASTDRAVARVDTMANFPKVMKNLGVNADEAEVAVNKVADGLLGLPTALDAGVRSVQRFTSFNNDVTKSADMFLAVNDAILAGGTDMQMQATALEQLTQAYTKGKMDIQEWRSLQQAMPAQLRQIADAMGMTTEQLGAGLRQNEKDLNYLRDVSMDEFIETIMKLDKEGGNGLASFSEQARDATKGIETSMANMETAIARGVANMINAVGQENIAGAINYLSGGIGEITNELAGEIKVASGFVMEHKEEIAKLVDTLVDLAPAAINAWGAFQLFKGGKALFSGITGLLPNLTGKLTALGESAMATGLKMDMAGKLGGESLFALGEILSTVTIGATGFVAATGIAIVALEAYNQSIMQSWRDAANLTAEQKELVNSVHTLAQSYDKVQESRKNELDAIDAEFDNVRALKDEYNSLVDANGQIIEGNEERAAQIVGEIASALGVEESAVYSLINAYGQLGDEASAAIEKRKLDQMIESGKDDYDTAVSTNADATEKAITLSKDYEAAQKGLYQATENLNGAIEDQAQFAMTDANALAGTFNNYRFQAAGAEGAAEKVKSLSSAMDENNATLTESADYMENYNRAIEAAAGGNLDQIIDAQARLQLGVKNAENNNRESLEAQVRDFEQAYNDIDAAIQNGATGMDDSLALVKAALDAANAELDEYNAKELKDKVASAQIEDGSLVIANDHVYEWNGTDLVDKGSVAEVEDSGLLTAQDEVYTWNGTDLESKSATAVVSVDTSAYDSWYPPVKQATVMVTSIVDSILGNASGGFFDLHAAGGFITSGPTYLGRDGSGAIHIAGEAGREWVQKHADGTTSILPIENRKYLEPYADVIASMIFGDVAKLGSATHMRGDTYNITVNASGNGDDIARSVTRAIRAQNLMKGRR